MKIKRLLFLFSLHVLQERALPPEPGGGERFRGDSPVVRCQDHAEGPVEHHGQHDGPSGGCPVQPDGADPVERGPDEHQHDDAAHVAAIPGEQLRRDRLPCDRYAEGRRLDEERGGEPDP